MTDQMCDIEGLLRQNAELRTRLDEAEETLRAIHDGEVDALVVAGPQGNQIFTLKGAESTYRVLVEAMNEGALVLTPDGTVMYSNGAFADMIDVPLEQVIGSRIHRFVHEPQLATVDELLQEGQHSDAKRELTLKNGSKDKLVQSQMSVGRLSSEADGISAVVTDLTEHKRTEAELQEYREHLEELVVDRTSELEKTNLQLHQEIEVRKQTEEALRASEERFRALFEHSPDAVFLTSPEGMTKAANPAACTMFGMTEEEFYRVGRSGIIDIEDPGHVLAEKERRRTGRIVNIELSYIRNSGERFPAEVSSVVFPGEEPHAFVLLRDITERKRAEEKLKVAHHAIASSINAIAMTDKGGSITYANSAALNLWGYEEQEALGKPFHCFFKDSERAIEIGQAILDGEEWTGEVVAVRKDGERLRLFLSANTVLDDTGNPTCMMASFTDITEAKRAEEALRESEHRYSTLFANKINGMAHCRVITDEEGKPANYRILQINEAYERIIGVRKADVEGQLVTDVFPDIRDYEADSIGKYGKVALEGGEIKFEGFFEATQQYLSIYAYSPAPGEFIAIFTDVTDRVQAEKALAEAKDMLERQVCLLQRALVPARPQIVEGYSVASAYIPAFAGEEIGGDFLDVFRTQEGKIGIMIGDVSGKGIDAAALAATSRSTVSAFAYDSSSAGDSLKHANSRLCAHQTDDMQFVTAFLAILDPMTGEINYSGAGHPPAIISHSNGDMELLHTHNLPLGVTSGTGYEEGHCTLSPGDRIVLYTDGITEARHDHFLFGTDGVACLVSMYRRATPDELVAQVLDAVRDWAYGELRDDTAILVIGRDV